MTHPPQLSTAYDRARDDHRAELVALEPPPEEDDAPRPPRRALTFTRFGDLAARVDAAGPRRYLVRGVWPQGDYGVLSAEPKAGKSWTAADLAVSVATGTPWLGSFPIDQPGPVTWFVGEGGEGNTVRRVRAVCRARGIDTDDLDLELCTRAPRLSNDEHMGLLADQLDAQRPALVVIDPLYLATGSAAKIGDLPAMGALLERPQLVCAEVGAALVVVHHNKRGEGSGVSRMSGAGPEEWGRVLISGSVRSRSTDPDTGQTSVVTQLEVRGGEIADRTVKVTRRVWADDPDDLDSPLHVETDVGQPEPEPARGARSSSNDGPGAGRSLPPAASKLLDALRDLGHPATGSQLVDRVVELYGHGLRRETVSKTMANLVARGLAHGEGAAGTSKLWRLADSPDLLDAPAEGCDRPVTSQVPITGPAGGVTTCDHPPLQGGGRSQVTRHTSRPADADPAVTGHRSQVHDSWRVSGQPLPPEPAPEEDR